MRCEPTNPLIGGKHTEGHVVVKDGKVADDLFAERQAAGYADEIFLREEAIVETHAAPDAITAGGKAESGHDDQIDLTDRNRIAGAGLFNSVAAGCQVC